MDADIQNPSQLNRFLADGMHKTEIVEWNKKRKSQSDQMDLLRPKHKCWVGNSSTEHALMFDENPVLESMHIYVVKGRTDATLLGDSSERESAKDSNSFAEDSNTAMSVNEEGKLEADSAKTNGRSFTSFVDWDGYNVKDNHCSFDVSAVEKKLEEHFLGLGSRTDHMDSEYAKDSFEESMDKDFEDILYSKGENPNMYVLSSGRWDVNQEAQSSTRTPTIDQEFEQYFSMLML
ncbi:protein FAR-RED ELONGATED HYPOCOTYL 1-like isoform X2 [Gastrolobium bilobum]|uniref:protein FAR-RED ELONGATED HYPOCOTYL 1-like isoform X2 n=1 Tax=Gastrolobium bilobum TaxID=150636 RepID=UPI002AAF9E54|nr:protein FAR-RED ELONGATED HYPOCOTYL 1-like isoform X2 [Gastrolobium bilobum]